MIDPLIVFVHTPRTAGTSLWFALMDALPDVRNRGRKWPQVKIAAVGHRMKERDAPRGFGLVGSALEDYLEAIRGNPFLKVCGGHLAYGLHKALGESCQYVTLIRDPVDRAISLYSMMRGRPVNYKSEDWSEPRGDPIAHLWAEQYDLSLTETMREREYRLCNDQVRMITGGSEDSEEAIALLQSEYVFGLAEDLSSFEAELSCMLRAPLVIGTHNILEREVNPKKQRVARYVPSPEELALIREANQADIKMYEWAKEAIGVVRV